MRSNDSPVGNLVRVRWAYEFFLGSAIAWTLVWLDRPRENPILPEIDRSLPLRHLNDKLGLVEPSTVFFQVFWSAVLAVCVFLILRLISRTERGMSFVGKFGGVFAVLAFPVLFLSCPSMTFTPARIQHNREALLSEVVAVGFAVVFLSLRKSTKLGFVLLFYFLHFSIWAWAAGFYVSLSSQLVVYRIWQPRLWVSTLFYFGFPFLSIVCTFFWELLRSSSKRRIGPTCS